MSIDRRIVVLLSICLIASPTSRGNAQNVGKSDWPGHPVNEWIKQSPTEKQPAPAFGWEGSGAFDPLAKKWIHFGGHDGIPQGFHLFTYDLETRVWEQRFPLTSPAGVCCIDGANTFDVANCRFVNFPGGSLGHGYQWSRGVYLRRSAVWLYDPAENTWTNMRPPPYHRPLTREENIGGLNAGAAYHPRHEISISFGGQGSQGGTSNLHFYDAYANKLTRINAANPPSPRDGMGICGDTKNDCLVVFGSQYASDEKTYLYRFSTGTWEAHDLKPRPSATLGKTYSTIPRLAYDSRSEICLGLFWDDATGKHETWTLDVAKLQWKKMDALTEPDPSMSRSRNLAFSPEHNVFILDLNPAALKGKGAQIWTYRIGPGRTVLQTVPAGKGRFEKPSYGTLKRLPPPADVLSETEANRVALSWKPVQEAASYRVYRSLGTQPWQPKFECLGDVKETGFIDTRITAKQAAHYMVRAVDANGIESDDSLRARSMPRVALKPIVSVLAKDQIEISWNRHPAKDIAGYNLYRGVVTVRTVKKGEPKPWRDNDPEYDEPRVAEVTDVTGIQKLNGKLLTNLFFMDRVDISKPLPQSKDYKHAVYAYVVRAVNRLGVESGPSPYALTIPSEPTSVFNREKGAMAELKWAANTERGDRRLPCVQARRDVEHRPPDQGADHGDDVFAPKCHNALLGCCGRCARPRGPAVVAGVASAQLRRFLYRRMASMKGVGFPPRCERRSHVPLVHSTHAHAARDNPRAAKHDRSP
jgi:hypothetical protein